MIHGAQNDDDDDDDEGEEDDGHQADEEEETQGSPNLLVPYLMLQGGILFLAGSILYLPSVARNVLGTWVFRTGTCTYLAGSFFSWRALAKSPGGVFSNCRVFFGILAFIAGALLYLAGGILSEMHLPGFAETWVAGSIFFVAPFIPMLSILPRQARDKHREKLSERNVSCRGASPLSGGTDDEVRKR